MTPLLWAGLGLLAILVFAFRKAAKQDQAESDAVYPRLWTEADELRENDLLSAAIAEWKESLVPMTDEQRERSWQYIASRLPQYPKRKRFSVEVTR